MRITKHRRKLTNALRSGKYGQTRAELRDRESFNFCCLGVACHISDVGKWKPNGSFEDNEAIEGRLIPVVDRSFMTPQVVKYLGIERDSSDQKSSSDPEYFDIHGDVKNPSFVLRNTEGKLLYTQGRWKDEHLYGVLPGVLDLAKLNDDGFTFEQIADCIDYFMK